LHMLCCLLLLAHCAALWGAQLIASGTAEAGSPQSKRSDACFCVVAELAEHDTKTRLDCGVPERGGDSRGRGAAFWLFHFPARVIQTPKTGLTPLP
jgi:hypothetical protein